MNTIGAWTQRAVSHIRFRPDRATVEAELRAHYEDHRDALLRAGKDRGAAERDALAALGDPDETGRLLNCAHRPWLGWAWSLSRWVVALAAALLLIGWFKFPVREAAQHYFSGYPTFYGAAEEDSTRQQAARYAGEPYPGETSRVCGVCAQEARAGDYAVSVERAFAYHAEGENGGEPYIYDGCNILLRARADSLTLGTPYTLLTYVAARDDRGNEYVNTRSTGNWRTDQPSLSGNTVGRRLNDFYFDLWLENYDPAARWVELYYDRMGVAFTLRIDLTGVTE